MTKDELKELIKDIIADKTKNIFPDKSWLNTLSAKLKAEYHKEFDLETIDDILKEAISEMGDKVQQWAKP